MTYLSNLTSRVNSIGKVPVITCRPVIRELLKVAVASLNALFRMGCSYFEIASHVDSYISLLDFYNLWYSSFKVFTCAPNVVWIGVSADSYKNCIQFLIVLRVRSIWGCRQRLVKYLCLLSFIIVSLFNVKWWAVFGQYRFRQMCIVAAFVAEKMESMSIWNRAVCCASIFPETKFIVADIRFIFKIPH